MSIEIYNSNDRKLLMHICLCVLFSDEIIVHRITIFGREDIFEESV